MDGNDLYDALVGPEDPYGRIRAVVDELSNADLVLTEEERAFLRGAQTSMMMNDALSPTTQRALAELCVRVRQRLHAGS